MPNPISIVRSVALTGLLALAAVTGASLPASASCVALDTMLPDPGSPEAVVFVGTVVGSDPIGTQLVVDGWYLGTSPADFVEVVGGRQPGTITSADWTPVPGEHYVVVALRSPEGILVTGTCEQALVSPDLMGALVARYGDAQLPPFPPMPSGSPAAGSSVPGSPVVTSGDSPLPDSLVHGSPAP